MKMTYHVFFSFLIAVACINWASQSSEGGREKPRINFKGTLRDAANKTISVENITIGKSYKDIPFYSAPDHSNIKPETNITTLDLREIAEIRPENSEDSQKGIVSYDNKKYIKLMVILNDKDRTPRTYLVETTRRIYCNEHKDMGDLGMNIAFEAIKSLTIEDHTVREETTPETITKRHLDREHQCAEVGKALQQLRNEADKLPSQQKGAMAELIESVKNWVGGICGTNS